MFRHIALFRWAEGTTPDQVAAVEAALLGLPAHLPELRTYRPGADAGLVEGNWDYAVVAEFDDEDAWRRYSADPEHRRIIAELIRPILGERAAVQQRG